MRHFDAESPRIVGSRFILDDTTFNAFAKVDGDDRARRLIDGVEIPARGAARPATTCATRGSATGDLSAGRPAHPRAEGPEPGADRGGRKVRPNRGCRRGEPAPGTWAARMRGGFASEWGAPFGDRQAVCSRASRSRSTRWARTSRSRMWTRPTRGRCACWWMARSGWCSRPTWPSPTRRGASATWRTARASCGLGYGQHRMRAGGGGRAGGGAGRVHLRRAPEPRRRAAADRAWRRRARRWRSRPPCARARWCCAPAASRRPTTTPRRAA